MKPSFSKEPWWRTDNYHVDDPIPQALIDLAGPHGPAIVVAWPDGRTSKGWGLVGKKGEPGFMENYTKKRFAKKSTLAGYEMDKWAMAFVTRSLRVVVIDIDGKNGGIEHAGGLLGNCPPTLAETSKSGDGYHLFFSVEDDWNADTGYSKYPDMIGVVTGVDIRSVGCVYHHNTQRWNGREIAPLPEWIADRLARRRAQRDASEATIQKTIEGGDDVEILVMQDSILEELKQPIPEGKRNVTLYALGHKMRDAEIEGWEDLLADRGVQLGLDTEEIEQIITNVSRYKAE